MPRRNLAIHFAARLTVVYILLVIPWPGVESAFGWIYRGVANKLAYVLHVDSHLHLGVAPGAHPRGDIEMVTSNPQTGQKVRIEFGSRDWGYLPLAAGLALILAVPRPWPLRFKGTATMVFLLLIFVGLRIAVGASYGLSCVGVFPSSPRVQKVLGGLMMSFSATPVTTYVIPALLWLVVLYWTYKLPDLSSEPRDASDQAVVSTRG